MKKTVMIMVASAGMLMAAPGMMMGQGMQAPKNCQCKGMMKQGTMKSKCTCGDNCKCGMKGKGSMHKKMAKKKMNSPFLIKHGLPHLTKMVTPYMNDPAFNLTAEQKSKLAEIRSETIGTIMQIKPEVMTLRKEIVQASTSGASADSLQAKVEKLAALEAKATMVHLKCIEKTKDVLTKDQLLFLLANKNKMKKHGMKKKMCKSKMMGRGMGQGQGAAVQKPKMMMKCAPGKCGMGK
jgi:hypothetical protein